MTINHTVYNNILNDYLPYFLQHVEVQKAKAQIDAKSEGSITFSIEIPDEIKQFLKDSLGLDLTAKSTVPMRWIKGDTKPHIDRGTEEFNNTYLAYLTNSSGQLLLDYDSYNIEAGSAFVFNEGTYHETRDTGGEPRLLLGPMSEQGLAVGGLTISGASGTSVYIQYLEGTLQYRYNNTDWSILSLPVFIQNTTPDDGGVFTVEFLSDITLTDSFNYFICISDNIQFGSSSLNTDGSRPIITVTASDYEGLVQNGTSFADGFINIRICNLVIDGTGGSQQIGAGWFGKQYFGKGSSENYIINCSSSGDIYGGGIVGDYAENITIIGCSSSGKIKHFLRGGIVGQYAKSITVNSCWSTGDIEADETGDGCGGIVGAYIEIANITNCYSTGNIAGNNAGGIIGANSGSISVTISNCYSTGIITGGNAGGICASLFPSNPDIPIIFIVSISNCYSTGNSTSVTSGCICGTINTGINGSIILTITNCYTSGTVTGGKGFIIGNETVITGNLPGLPITYSLVNNYCEAGSLGGSPGNWINSHANTVLQNPPGASYSSSSIWLTRYGTDNPYELFNMGYNPYSTTNITFTPSASLIRTSSATVTVGNSTNPAIKTSGPYYTFLEDYTTPFGININNATGVISTSSSTPPNTYTLYVYNTGSYNITAFLLLVNAAATTAAAATEQPCCARPMFLTNVNYDERTTFIAGNTLLATERRGPLSYSDIMYQKKAKAAKYT